MPEGYVTEEYSSKKNSLEQSHKRAYNGGTDNSSSKKHHGEGRPILKVLIPNFFAGDIIGKKGAKRIELEAQYHCKVKFSPNKVYYPGTDQRIVTFSGAINDIIGIHNYVIETLDADAINDRANYDSEHNNAKQVVKIICPNACAGLIIGSGGADIKALQELTKAKVVVGRREESQVPSERIIRITGALEHRIDAANKIANKIAGDPENIRLGYNLDYSNECGDEGMGAAAISFRNNFSGSTNNRFYSGQQQSGGDFSNSGSYGGRTHWGGYGGAPQNMSNFGGNYPNNNVSQIETSITIKMKIPEILVGVLMGNQSQTLREVIDFSGAQIQLTPRNEYGPRTLTIDGDTNQSQSAHFLINQKIQRAIDAMNQSC